MHASTRKSDRAIRHVSDQQAGLTRRRNGKGFSYFSAKGRRVRDAATIDRINRLAIPPAWERVWICPLPDGHLQASGRDAKGRKQHRYHADFRAIREGAKFDHVAEFGHALPALRHRIEKDRRRQGLPREKILATIVYLLDNSLIRVGNEEYAAQNKSYGLTTLRNRHVKIAGDQVQFVFSGKSGKLWKVRMKDRRVARAIKAMQDLPGQHLFQYLAEDGAPQTIGSADVNQYLRDLTGRDISAKDFRTWAGSVLAAAKFAELPVPPSPAAAKRAIKDVILEVSKRLGNTPAICRKCYVHPHIVDLFEKGGLTSARRPQRALPMLSPSENRTLALLPRTREARGRKPGAPKGR